MRVFPACFEHFLQSGKPCSNFKSKGLQTLSVDSIELDDVNEAEEDLPVEGEEQQQGRGREGGEEGQKREEGRRGRGPCGSESVEIQGQLC